MGRRPASLDGDVEELLVLAADLRKLRYAAGNPPLRTMAMRARYSASTLSEATSGRRLPTLQVVLAYVTACEADPAGWEGRWRKAAAAVQLHKESTTTNQDGVASNRIDAAEAVAQIFPREGTSEDGTLTGPLPAHVPTARKAPHGPGESLLPAVDHIGSRPVTDGQTTAAGLGRRLRRPRGRTVRSTLGGAVLILVVAAYLIGLRDSPAAVPGVRLNSGGPAAPALTTQPGLPRVIAEDTDPQDTGCDQGQVDTLAVATLYGPDRFFLGYVWLRYAPACDAMWTRFEPAANLAQLAGAKVTIWLVRPGDGRTLRYDAPYLGAFVYGNMLHASRGCLKATAMVTAPHPTRGPAAALPGNSPVVAQAGTQCVSPPLIHRS